MRRSSATAWAALSTVAVRDFWRQMALLLVVLGFVNASNYLFHVVISRLLGPSDYGALAALLAVVLVFSIPLGVIQTAVADKTATLRSVGRDDDVRPLAASALKTTAPFAYASGIAVALVAVPYSASSCMSTSPRRCSSPHTSWHRYRQASRRACSRESSDFGARGRSGCGGADAPRARSRVRLGGPRRHGRCSQPSCRPR